jgi:hypothetical protein
MLTTNFAIRVGATIPYLAVQITQSGIVPLFDGGVDCCGPEGTNPDAVDLTEAKTITFEMVTCARFPQPASTQGTVEIIEDDKTGRTQGRVQYKWHPNDTLVAGQRYGTFVVTFNDNSVLRWPFQKEALSIAIED